MPVKSRARRIKEIVFRPFALLVAGLLSKDPTPWTKDDDQRRRRDR